MGPEVWANPQFWNEYNLGRQKYVLWRSCKYEPTPGQTAPPSEGNLPPCLTVWIFVHELRTGREEEHIGKISIFVYRERWKDLAHLDNEVEANDQLKRAANSARDGVWEIEPLTRMLNQGFNEILRQINNFENNRSEISGEFPLQ